MEMDDLTQDDLFSATDEERARIRNGTANYIAREEKQRVLDLLPEVLRFRVDLRDIVSLFRGGAYVLMQAALGEDFLYIMIRPVENMRRMQMLLFLQRIAPHLQLRFGLDVNHADLSLSLIGGEKIQLEYSVLDLSSLAQRPAAAINISKIGGRYFCQLFMFG